jgi:hypothetical protein
MENRLYLHSAWRNWAAKLEADDHFDGEFYLWCGYYGLEQATLEAPPQYPAEGVPAFCGTAKFLSARLCGCTYGFL